MRLTELKEGEEAVVEKLIDKNNTFLRRIEAMGLKKGEKIKLEKIIGRNYVVLLEGRKLAIDRELASLVEVKK